MNRYWNQNLRRLEQPAEKSVPGENLVNLSDFHNPFPPSDKVLRAVRRAVTAEANAVAAESADRLALKYAAKYAKLQPQNVTAAVSVKALADAAAACFFKKSRPVLFPEISPSVFQNVCILRGFSAEELPVEKDFSVNPAAFDRRNGGILLANPNAYTGAALKTEEIEQILRANPGSVVVIDETFGGFGAVSALSLVKQYPNLIILQSSVFSRSLGGFGAGFAYAQAELIDALERYISACGLGPSLPVIAANIASYHNCRAVDAHLNTIRAVREGNCIALRGIGFEVIRSEANFFTLRYWGRASADIVDAMAKKGYLVAAGSHPLLSDWFTVTIGSKEDMRGFLDALEELIDGSYDRFH